MYAIFHLPVLFFLLSLRIQGNLVGKNGIANIQIRLNDPIIVFSSKKMIIYQEITAIDKLQGFLDNSNCKFVNKLKKKKKMRSTYLVLTVLLWYVNLNCSGLDLRWKVVDDNIVLWIVEFNTTHTSYFNKCHNIWYNSLQ